MLKGKDIIIEIEGQTMASNSCEINLDTDTIETSSPDTGIYRTFIPGRKTWTLTTSHIMSEAPVAVKGFLGFNGRPCNIDIKHTDSEYDHLRGTAIVTNDKVSAAVNKLAYGSFAFQGTGPLQHLGEDGQWHDL